MVESTSSVAANAGLGTTERKDNWWASPLAVAIGFAAFIVYATWAAFQNAHYLYTEGGAYYLSPFYSPDLLHIFGRDIYPSWVPSWIPHSPAFLILWMPAGFRATCYYYRKAYYRAYFLDPPACAVGERAKRYKGETSFPLILQNAHRYFLYLAIFIIVVLGYDAVRSFIFDGRFGVGVGSLVLTANVVLLSFYTFGCHSFRHLVGGRLDCFSCGVNAKMRHGVWSRVTKLNEHHQLWAWCSLFVVGFTDLYVRLCSMGIWTDVRII